MFTETVGLGISFTGTAHEGKADLDIRIPHPRFFNAFATDAAPTEGKLKRQEGGVNLQLMLKTNLANDNVRVRLFGGPTYFRLKADGVSAIFFDQVFQLFNTGNVVEITEYNTVVVEETGWGFHAGGDVSYFFSRIFGLGGFARFSRGTVTISDFDVLADGPVDVKVGGFQGGGGLRFRF